MLLYMRSIWREEYWKAVDIDIIIYCGKLVRQVDKLSNPMYGVKRDYASGET